MRIGIDAQSAAGKSTGIGFYTRNLINYIEKTGEASFERFVSGKDDLNTIERIKWENSGLLRSARKDKIDLLHVPGFAGPMFKRGIKTVTTVHDLIGMIYPENLGRVSRFYWQKWLPTCVKNSDIIIADSENTKNDIIRLLGVPEEKICVILLAVDDKFRPLETATLDIVRKKYGLSDKFMLNVGTIEPRKNISGLVEAFTSYIKDYSGEMDLVLVGKKDWGYRQVKRRVEELGVADRVVFTDYVDDDDLPALYNLAKLFVYPSFYEGFGLPVLEALSSGCPVIASNVSSIPEIVGEAGILLAPDDTEGLTNSFKKFDENRSMQLELSDMGIERSKKFSWQRTAEETLDVYRKILKK
ncbi:MAG: glycosyltransferase family 1 protein [Candidatus Aadella gelida]|nr:glycosyltransferase family 1 protein [Candidatus Aadella gelida]